MRHKLLQEEAKVEPTVEEMREDNNNKVHVRDIRKRRPERKKLHTLSSAENSQNAHGRCPERATWEKSWRRVRLKRPNFRDRIRVWQAIAELKRAGGRGRMGITNNEAWTALRDSSGSTSVAAALLANEEYLLGRRLQQQDDRRGLDEVPSYLSLLVYDSGPNVEYSHLLPPGFASPAARPSSTGIGHADRTPPTKGKEMGPGPVSDSDIFECVSGLFYKVLRTTKPAYATKKCENNPRCLALLLMSCHRSFADRLLRPSQRRRTRWVLSSRK